MIKITPRFQFIRRGKRVIFQNMDNFSQDFQHLKQIYKLTGLKLQYFRQLFIRIKHLIFIPLFATFIKAEFQ